MKKYLLIIEDEKLWDKFKQTIKQDINSEIIELVKKKAEGKDRGFLESYKKVSKETKEGKK